MTETSKKHALSIKLAEGAVFLRSRDHLARHNARSAAVAESHPGVLRGLLILHLEKPTKISSIDVKLTCRSTATWPEGLGARRIDITESHDVFSSEQVFFKARADDRRRSSVPPKPDAYGECSPRYTPSSRRTPSPDPPLESPEADPGSSTRRRRHLSTDLGNFQAEAIHCRESQVTVPETPPLTLEGHNGTDSPSSLQEFRRVALKNGTYPTDLSLDTPPVSSASSTRSFRGRTLSRRPSFEDVPENDIVPAGPSGSRSATPQRNTPRQVSRTPSRTPLSPRSPERESLRSSSVERRGRRRSARFSLSAVSNALLDVVRQGSPQNRTVLRSRSTNHSPEGSPRGRSRSGRLESGETELIRKDSHGQTSASKIERYLHREKAVDSAEWKEFRPGTYTYAISIPIPADQPPTLECPYGSVIWRLKATVHRPGTFTSKLTRSVNVEVIHSPIEEDQEELDSITVERHWDQQLQYLVSLSARHFYIGGTIPFTLTLLPLAKVKIHKLTVYIEERVDYLTQMKRVARSDPKSHILLLSAKSAKNDSKPILPLESDDPDAFRLSPLYQFLGTEDDPSEMASSLMGPGPWTFQKELQLPASCSLLHWTNKNKKSNVLISHVLKCIIRLERGDDREIDSRTGKRKLFDIVIQTEVDIRSCRLNPDWAGLPPYSQTFRDPRTFDDKCPCQLYSKSEGQMPSIKRMLSTRSTDSDASTADSASIDGTMQSLQGSDTLYRQNMQYERLISGQETEAGEIPPPYQAGP